MQNYQIIPQMTDKKLTREKIDELSDFKEQRFRELIDQAGKIELIDGVEKLIDTLKKQGFKLAIGTSTPAVNLKFLLEHMPVNGQFDDFVTGEEVENGKPFPDTFLRAAEKINIPAENCVVVEDAVSGVQAGKAAGMKVIAVATTRDKEQLHQADMVFDKPGDLKADIFVELLGQ
jgi:beta-phosphoglucomutase